MPILLYTVLVEADAEGPEHGFGAYCPDVPGCVGAGPTAEAAVADLRSALAFHLEGEIPPPARHRAVEIAVEVSRPGVAA